MALNVKGQYNSSANYGIDDVVVVIDKVYKCIKPCTGISYSNDDYWRMLIDPIEDAVHMVNNLKTAMDSIVKLPQVTATDNGKVLKVVDGAWAAASAT